MLGLDMLDVAIGVVFVFLLVSLIASAVAELFESWLKYRASDLERGIRELLKGDTDLVQELYEHPLISSLYEGTSHEAAKAANNLPSYIPARSFALALMDLTLGTTQDGGTAAGQNVVEQKGQNIERVATDTVAKLRQVAAKVPEGAAPPKTLDARIAELPAEVAHMMLTHVDAAAGDVQRLRAELEASFNATMDRVSGWFKRRNHQILVAIGLVLAVLFNIDTIAIVQSLWTNKGMRDAGVAAASAFAKVQPPPGADPAADIKKYTAALGSLNLPIGWAANNCGLDPATPIRARFTSPAYWDCWLASIPLHFFGWLLTAIAVSMGAPFWFDTLNKIIVIRSTVKPAEKSGVEAPKDPQAPPQKQQPPG